MEVFLCLFPSVVESVRSHMHPWSDNSVWNALSCLCQEYLLPQLVNDHLLQHVLQDVQWDLHTRRSNILLSIIHMPLWWKKKKSKLYTWTKYFWPCHFQDILKTSNWLEICVLKSPNTLLMERDSLFSNANSVIKKL